MAVKRKRSTRSLDGATTPSSAKVNGTPKSSKSASKATPTLSLAAWVDYKIKYPQLRKGRKGRRKSGASNEPALDPQPYFEGAGEVYEVVPRTWDDLQRYKKFRLMEDVSDPMTIGDVVLVNNDDGVATGEIDIFKQWKAHVLEIRAQDPQHVYLRVFWIYDPNELPGARRPYHGLHELVPSNDMAIIDAMTINGPVSVKKWNEYDDDDEPYTGTDANPGFFWRQTYNVHTGRLSQLRQHCFCNAPANPDNLLVQCTNKATCGRWLHGDCLTEKAVQKATSENPSHRDLGSSPSDVQGTANVTPTKSSTSPAKGKKKTSAAGKEEEPVFIANVVMATGKRGHRLRIQDIRKDHEGKEREERIFCPCCNSLLLDEGEEQPPTPPAVEMDNTVQGEGPSADEITVRSKETNGAVNGIPTTPANAPSSSIGIIGSIASSIFGGGI